jgi:hypothetical protein
MRLSNPLKIKILIFLILALFTNIIFAEDVIQVGCRIFDLKGNLIYHAPIGDECIFLSSGDFIATSHGVLKYSNVNPHKNWTVEGYYHHQIKLSNDGKRVYALSAKTHKLLGKEARIDIVKVVDIKSGKVTELDLYYFLSKIYAGISFQLRRGDFQKELFDYDIETTHVNSIFEIPDNVLAKTNPVFRKGNWLINLGFTRSVAIFDKNLKKLLWRKKYENYSQVPHDVQLTKEGVLVFYVNSMLPNTLNESKERYTSILFLNPLEEFPKDYLREIVPLVNKQRFEQKITGGYQELPNGDKLISVYSNEDGFQLAMYDSTMKLKLLFTPTPRQNSHYGEIFQEAKLINLDRFFKNRREL